MSFFMNTSGGSSSSLSSIEPLRSKIDIVLGFTGRLLCGDGVGLSSPSSEGSTICFRGEDGFSGDDSISGTENRSPAISLSVTFVLVPLYLNKFRKLAYLG